MNAQDLAADVQRHLRAHGIGPDQCPDEIVMEVCGELAALDELNYREQPRRLWVDVTYRPDGRGLPAGADTFGPFISYEAAEDCLVGLASRRDVLRAHIRDPEGGRA